MVKLYVSRLRQRRIAAFIGMREFAERIGVLPSVYCDIENGRHSPFDDPAIFERIEDELHKATQSLGDERNALKAAIYTVLDAIRDDPSYRCEAEILKGVIDQYP